MFKKLKKKFVIINMFIVSVVMIISFNAIYWITYFNIQNQNQLKMESIASSTLRYMEMSQNDTMRPGPQMFGQYIQGFGLVVNEQGEYIFESYFGTMSKDDLAEAMTYIQQQNKQSGEINLFGQKFQYLISRVFTSLRFDNEEIASDSPVKQVYQITFVNVTDSHQTLIQLFVTLIIIGALTLIAIFWISVYFAKQSIIPIEQSYMKQKQFIQDASHELKTPLASIRANLDAVNSNPNETVLQQKKWLGFISIEVERMTKLVADLLYLAKNEYCQSPTDHHPVGLSKIVENTIASVEVLAFEKGITFKVQIESEVIVQGDENKILQVVKILLDNALKYTDPSGQIKVNLTRYKHQSVLSISNTGKGVGKEHIAYIFERFYRADASRKHDGGYGLGLAIAKSLVESIKGEITVASIPNEETTFTVKFNNHI
ncbi:MAG: sensor histidine kinase [Cellulosilyticaceae bacterium]